MTLNINFISLTQRTTVMVAGLVGSIFLHGISASITQASEMEMTLGGVTWVGLTPFYVAQEKGYFAENGLEVDLQIFGANTDYISAYLANRIDGAISSVTSENVLMADKEKDFKIVMIQDNSAGADGILARNSVASIADFKGQKVAVEQGGVGHFFLLQVLKEAGLSSDDITIINADAPTAATAYQAGNVDIASSYAPFLSQANEAQTDGRIIYDSSKMPSAITDFYTFSTDYIEANPEAVQAFVDGIAKALGFIETNRAEAVAIAAAQLEVTPEALDADLAGIDLPSVETNIEMLTDASSDIYILNSLNAMGDFLLKQGQIKAIPDMAEFIDPTFVQSIQTAE